MDDKDKTLDFGDFLTTKYGYGDDHTEYRRKRLKNGAMHEEVEEEVETDEALSHAQRMKASQRMRKMSKRIQMAKKRALRRAPSMDVLKKRAQRQARNDLLKKWTRGQSKGELSFGRRAELEKRLKKSSAKIQRKAQRLLPQMRKKDRERRAGAGKQDDK